MASFYLCNIFKINVINKHLCLFSISALWEKDLPMLKTAFARYLSLILLGLLLYSCTSWNTSLGRRAQYQYQSQQALEFSTEQIQYSWWQERQVFQVSADRDTVLYTEQELPYI